MTSVNIIFHYKAEIRFAVILTAIVALSIWASRFIPEEYFDSAITPILMSASTAVALCCAWISFRHTEGYRMRRIWGWTLLLWGILDGLYVISCLFMGKPVMNMGACGNADAARCTSFKAELFPLTVQTFR